MKTNPSSSKLAFQSVTADDFEVLLAIRTAAMRPSLEHLGRYDPERSRQRLLDLFFPDDTQLILQAGHPVGFYTLRSNAHSLELVHLYVVPASQSQGIGAAILTKVFAIADEAHRPIHLCALKASASNQFYRRHGFVALSEEEWNINYHRPASATPSPQV